MRQEGSQAKWCIVSVDGKDVYKLLLANKSQVKIIGPLGEAIVKIQDNGVRVKDSPCPLKICMHQGVINKPGQTIVCVPNRIMIRIMGEKKEVLPQVDAMTE